MFFFFNDTATTEIYTLSLHDALPICKNRDQPELFVTGSLRQLVPDDHILARVDRVLDLSWLRAEVADLYCPDNGRPRSEEHTSELQSRQYLVCRLLLEKKKKKNTNLL